MKVGLTSADYVGVISQIKSHKISDRINQDEKNDRNSTTPKILINLIRFDFKHHRSPYGLEGAIRRRV